MTKKKIAFVMGTIYLGGAERALINMLNHFDYSRYDVDLWICGSEAGNTDLINKNVTLNFIDSEFSGNTGAKTVFKYWLNHNPFKIFLTAVYYFLAKVYKKNKQKNYFFYSLFLPPISQQNYDVVIAYRGWDESILRLSFNRLLSKRYIVWMHNNTYDTKFPFNYFYKKADKIFCVSQTIKNNVFSLYNVKEQNLDVFYNILDKDDIVNKANMESNVLCHPSILSVGRLSWEKGFEIIPEVASILKKNGLDFMWYIIGEGYKRKEIETQIKKFNVNDCVILLGAKNNPYPYFKQCDVFVQTSITEGYCITTAEAKLFQKPVVTSNIPVMYEQFKNMKNGIIVDETNAVNFAKSIELLLSNKRLYDKIVLNLSLEEENKSGYSSLYDYIDSL